MHSQIVRPHTPSYEHQAVGEDEGEHHHEKKSVLKKVKAKAKKIKETLKLHGQGHHDHDAPDDHDLDEEDDEDDEMAIDPEIHGASGLSSTAIRSSVPEQVENLGDTRNYYGSSMQDDSSPPGYSRPLGTDLPKSSLPKQEEHHQGDKVGIERTDNIKDVQVPYTPLSSPAYITPRVVEQPKAVDPIAGYSTEEEAIRGKPDVSMANTVRFEEDPDAPKTRPQDQIPTNYETKVANPTSEDTKEIESSSILHKLGQMHISDEPKPEAGELVSRQRDQSIFPTGSHHQFSPGPTPPIPIISDEVTQSVPQQSNASKSEDSQAEKGPIQSSYTQKIASATSAIADKAISAKNIVASKLGYGARDDAKENDVQEKSPASSSPVAYGKKTASTVTEKITPVYEKVAEIGSNLMSKAHLTRGRNDGENNMEGKDQGVSVRDYFSEKLRPGEEDRALSEVISEALCKKKNGTEKKEKKLGKVTESEKVKEQLGTVEDSDGSLDASAVNIPGGAVVNKLKEVVGSYFGEGGETLSTSQQALESNDSGGFRGQGL